MIEGLKPYAEYKESGLPWLGNVPAHWVTKRGKSYMTAIDRRSQAGKEELLTVSSARGVIPRNTAKVTMFKAESYAGYKLCWPGDLVINSLWAWGGGLGVTQHHGIISTAYSVYRPRPSAQMNPRFLHELVRSSAFHWELQVRSKGVWISRLQLTDTSFLDSPIPLPPPEEQAAIVRFLDHANRKIDGFIRAKRKLIGLLNEQKQAIIHRAVTRGLHPDVPLKPSGIPWLGDIPKHWDVRPIKHWTKINARTLGEATAASFEFRYIDIGAVRTGRLVAAPEVMRFDRSPSRARRVLVAGDTIISTVRTYLKAVWFAGENPVNLVASTGFAVFSPLASVEPEYLSYVLQDSGFVDQVTGNSVGIAYPAIAESVLARLRIAIPPSRSEQVGIIVAIKDQTGPLNTAISRTEREIALMQEYRTRLTADLVTGKLDVREAAAQLPAPPNDAPAPDEPLEEIETELEETNDANN